MRTISVLLCLGLLSLLTMGNSFGEKSNSRQLSDELFNKGKTLLENEELISALKNFNAALKADPSNIRVFSLRWQAQLMIIERDIRKAAYHNKASLLKKHRNELLLHQEIICKETIDILNRNQWTEEVLTVAMSGFNYGIAPKGKTADWEELKKQGRIALLKNFPYSETSESMTNNAVYETLSVKRVIIPHDAEKTWEKGKLEKAIEAQKETMQKRIDILEKVINEYPVNLGHNTAWAYRLVFYGTPDFYGGKNHFRNLDEFDKTCERWLKAEPNNPAAHFYIASLSLKYGHKIKEAVEHAGKALAMLNKKSDSTAKQSPKWKARLAAYTLLDGRASAAKGDYSAAIPKLKNAYELNSENKEALFYIGQAYQKDGNLGEAKNWYIKCLQSTYHRAASDELAKISEEKSLPALRKKLADKKDIPTFTDVTFDADLFYMKGDEKTRFTSGRVAIGDYNNDGWDDILLNGNILLRNNANGKFINVTFSAGVCRMVEDKAGKKIKAMIPTSGGVWGDYDNDGFLDFYAIAGKGSRDYLFHNNGDGTFTDVTEKAGAVYDNYPSEGAAWVDFNGDGFLDIYVANYEDYSVSLGSGTPDFLYLNQRNGTFKRVDPKKQGILPKSYQNQCGRGVSPADFDSDGDMDIFVSNYRLNPNFLWENRGNGYFKETSREHGIKGIPSAVFGTVYLGHTIGSQWADFNNDGYLDLISCNLAHPRYIGFSNKTMLYINQGSQTKFSFGDIRQFSGIGYEETHSDPAVADFDNDGFLDLFMTSIYVGRKAYLYRNTGHFLEPDPSIPYDNDLPEKPFKNKPMFEDVSWVTGTRIDNGWGCAWFDYDNDGDLDLIVGSGSGVHLMRNDNQTGNNWLKVKLVGARSNRSAIGAQVYVFGKIPVELLDNPLFKRKLNIGHELNYILTRHVEGGKGTTSQSSLTQHFGLGKKLARFKMNIFVRWPGGKTQILRNVEPNKYYEIRETDYLDQPAVKVLELKKK